MLPARAIIINYTQEHSWNEKRTAERGEQGGIKGFGAQQEIRKRRARGKKISEESLLQFTKSCEISTKGLLISILKTHINHG